MSTSPDADGRRVPSGPPPGPARVPAWAPVRIDAPATRVTPRPATPPAPVEIAPGWDDGWTSTQHRAAGVPTPHRAAPAPTPPADVAPPAHVAPPVPAGASVPPAGASVPPAGAPVPPAGAAVEQDASTGPSPSRRLRTPPVRVAAAATALVVSVAVAAASLAGDDPAGGAAVVAPTASATPSPTAGAAVDREVGRLQVDLAVARATLAGASQVDATARRDLERAVIAAQAWLDAYVAPATTSDADRALREVTAHRDVVATLLAQMETSRPAPTVEAPAVEPTNSAPAPRATPGRAPARSSGSSGRRPAVPAPAPTAAPTGDPSPAPSFAPPTTAPTAAPAPTAPAPSAPAPSAAAPTGPTAPGPTAAPEPTVAPGGDEQSEAGTP